MSVSQIKVTQKLLLNTNNSKPNDRLIVKQGCVGTVYIEAKINDKGGIMEYPSGTTAAIRMLSNGKSQILDDCDPIVNNNTITFPVSQKMQDDPGDALCEIILIYGGTSFTTVTFPITIEANVHNDSNIKGAPEYTTLINALVRVEAAEQIANTAYEVATEAQTILVHTQSEEIEREASEVIRVSNETSRNSAESARVIAENARNSNETGRTTAETSRASAEASRATEESKRVTAESGRTTAESSRASAESGRTTAEQNRSTAENSRILAESNRVTEYNAMITNGYIVPKAPVATFAALATTYTSPVKGWTSKVLADGKVYRYDGTVWSWIDTITASSYDALLTTFTAQLAENASQISAIEINKADLTRVNALEAYKADLTYVNTQIQAVVSGSPKGVYADTTALQTAHPNGNDNIYVVATDGRWYYWNGSAWVSGGVYQSSVISDNSIKLKSTAFKPISNGTQSKNLFDKDAIKTSIYLNNLGVEFVSAGYFTSDFISASASTRYYLNSTNANRKVVYYDTNKSFLSYATGANAITTPTNTAYIRIGNINSELDTMQLEAGTSFTGYVKYGYLVEEVNLGDVLRGVVNNYKDNKNNYITGTPTKNMFNKISVTSGVYLNDLGVEFVAAGYFTSSYIAVSSNTQYYLNSTNANRKFAFYDIDKKFISKSTGVNAITTPANTCYVKIANVVAELNTMQFELGTSFTGYIAYGTRLLKSQLGSDVPLTTRVLDITKSLTDTTTLTKIKIIGDSITAGVGGTGYAANGEVIFGSYKANASGHCWANLLRDYFQSKFNCIVKNWGISGITSTTILSNLSTLIEADDDIVICMIGTNNRNTGANTPVSKLASDLETIANYVTGSGKEIIFMSSVPASVSNETDVNNPKSYHMEDVDFAVFKATSNLNREYISLYKEVLNYCDIKGISIDSLLPDGLHPGDALYTIMFNIVCDKLGIGRKRPGATW